MLARLVLTFSFMLPDAPDERRQQRFPPPPRVPSAQVAAEIARPRRAANEHRQAAIAAGFVQKTIDEARLLLRAELALPQRIEVAILDDALCRKRSARQRVAEAETEEVVLKTGGFADESRAAARRVAFQMKVHVRVAGARLRRSGKRMQTLRSGEGMIEVVVDAFEIGHNRATESRQSVENEQIGVAAGRELVIEEDVDAFGLARPPRHLARQSVGRGRTGRDDVRRLQSRVEDHLRSGRARLLEQSAVERSLPGSATNEPAVRLAAADRARVAAMIVERGPFRRTKIKVSGDADAIEKERNGLALRCRLDDLQIADEARPDVRPGLVNLDSAAGFGEYDRCCETRWPRACNTNRLHLKSLIVVIAP